MDWSSINFVATRSIARDTLGPVVLKQAKSLFVDICLVFLDVKPALLIDTFCADPASLTLYVRRLEEYLTHHQPDIPLRSVQVLDIEGDVVIVNDTQWSRITNSRAFEDVFFVDASSTLKDPRPLDDATRRKLIKRMSETFSDAAAVETRCNSESVSFWKLALLERAGICVPSLFGVLLGYPVVYYTPDDDNCLGLVPLSLVTLKGRINDDPGYHICLSFSVPSPLFTHDILTCLHSMKTRAASHLRHVQISVENVIQTSISL